MIPRYRAWHKTGEEMCKVKRIRFDDEENILTVFVVGKTSGSNAYLKDVELMQSTGLRDKNGKEVFEGDIVQFEDCYEVSDFLYINTGIIEWCQGGFHVTNRDSVLMEDLLDGDSLDVTIIGNIYENPELLEDKE